MLAVEQREATMRLLPCFLESLAKFVVVESTLLSTQLIEHSPRFDGSREINFAVECLGSTAVLSIPPLYCKVCVPVFSGAQYCRYQIGADHHRCQTLGRISSHLLAATHRPTVLQGSLDR